MAGTAAASLVYLPSAYANRFYSWFYAWFYEHQEITAYVIFSCSRTVIQSYTIHICQQLLSVWTALVSYLFT